MSKTCLLGIVGVLLFAAWACGGDDGDSVNNEENSGSPKGDMTESMGMTEECKGCASDKCGSELAVCNSSQSCLDYWDCVAGCAGLDNDDKCVDVCIRALVQRPDEDFASCGPQCKDAENDDMCRMDCCADISPEWRRAWNVNKCVVIECGKGCLFGENDE